MAGEKFKMFLQTGSVKLHYTVHGSGTVPLILLHGTIGWGKSFTPLLPHLPSHYQLFIPDLRGHGASSHVAQRYRVVDFAEDIVAFIEAILPTTAVILGHSLGGLIGVAIAAKRPDLVQALIIEDAPLWLRRTTVQAGSSRAYHFFSRLYELLQKSQNESDIRTLLPQAAPEALAHEGESLVTRLALLDPDVLQMSYNSSLMENFDIDSALSQISCPTLVLQADPAAGGSMLDEDVSAVLSHLLQGTHAFMAGSGHTIHREQPAQLAELVEEWLTAVL